MGRGAKREVAQSARDVFAIYFVTDALDLTEVERAAR